MDLSTIPLPEGRTAVTVVSHMRAFPDAPGSAPGVVERGPDRRTTVQCAVCLRTATGATPAAPIIHAGWNHTSDDYDALRGPKSPPTPYKRCPDCRAAHRHPAEQLDMLDLLEGDPQ